LLDMAIAARKRRAGQWSAKTTNNTLRLLHVMLERAVRWRLLKVNAAAHVDKLRVEQPETATLSPNEVRAIIDQAPRVVGLFVLAAVLTGARKNEVLSLTWDRVDFETGTLRIDRQCSPDGWAPLKARKRTHALPEELRRRLLEHRNLAAYAAPDDFVFATLTGRPIGGRNMLRWFKDAAVAVGIERTVWISPAPAHGWHARCGAWAHGA
jgi:integrase